MEQIGPNWTENAEKSNRMDRTDPKIMKNQTDREPYFLGKKSHGK